MFLPPKASLPPTPDASVPPALEVNVPPAPDAPSQPPPLNEFEGADAAAELAICSPLSLGKTLIVYHPHSKLPPKIIDTDLPQRLTSPNLRLDGMFDDEDDPPYWPFRTLGDFEQTEFFVTNNFSNRQIDHQLRLLTDHTRPPYPGGGISLSSAREMHKLLRVASEGCDQSLVRVVVTNIFTH